MRPTIITKVCTDIMQQKYIWLISYTAFNKFDLLQFTKDIKEIELLSPKRVVLWQSELTGMGHFSRSKCPGDSIECSSKCVLKRDLT